MFVLPLSLAVGTFTPSALPDFIAIPVPIPRLHLLLSSLSVAFAYSIPLRLKRSRVVRRAWLLVSLVVLLDAVCDPGE